MDCSEGTRFALQPDNYQMLNDKIFILEQKIYNRAIAFKRFRFIHKQKGDRCL